MDAMFSTIQDLVFVGPKDVTLLGSPLGSNSTVDCSEIGRATVGMIGIYDMLYSISCAIHWSPTSTSPSFVEAATNTLYRAIASRKLRLQISTVVYAHGRVGTYFLNV